MPEEDYGFSIQIYVKLSTERIKSTVVITRHRGPPAYFCDITVPAGDLRLHGMSIYH